MFFDTTDNATPGIFVDTNRIVSFTNTAVTATRPVTFTTNGTNSGVTLQDAGTVSIASYTVACTGTGGDVKVDVNGTLAPTGATGGAKYDTCLIPPLLSTTGAITRLSLMISAAPANTTQGIDCGFTKVRRGGTGTNIQNLNNIITATGAYAMFGTGTIRWNKADFIKCGMLTNPTSSFAAKLKVEYFDDTSE